MNQTSTKRRNIIIASIVIVLLVISSIIVLIEYNQLATTRISLLLSTTQTELIQGSSSQIQVYVTSIGKAENITLSSNVGSSDISCTFEPPFGESNFTSTLTYVVPNSTPTGNYSITVIASGDGQAVNVSSVLSVLCADVTVSGQVGSTALSQPYLSSLIGIQFTDIQTGTKTSFDFHFPPPPSLNPFGNYSVALMSEHTYRVTISYYTGPSSNNMWQTADDIGNFTVHVPSGETAISKDFA